jgi:single-strand DNA-binding protein
MNDTEITVVGTVLTTPERRRTEKSNAVVTTFLVVSNSRRFDREAGQWVDGATFRVRVSCWRRLADHVFDSVFVGDPVVIKGRITTRDWRTEQDEPRTAYNVDAITVGHDLNRGRATFAKAKPPSGGLVVDDADYHVNGEPTELLSEPPMGADGPDNEGSVDDFAFGQYAAGTFGPDTTTEGHTDAASILAGLDPRSPEDDEGEDEAEADLVGAAAGSGGSGGRGRRRGR